MKTIPLSRGLVTLLDDEDFDRFGHLKWCAARGYAEAFYALHRKSRREGYVGMLLHREIVEVPFGLLVDHINGNTLDNRRANLRICTQSENLRNRHRNNSNNTSGFRGVIWSKVDRKWLARIGFNYQQKYVGLFDSKEEASKARDSALVRLHGEFSSPNFRT